MFKPNRELKTSILTQNVLLAVVCRGYAGSSRIHTFDGQSYVKFCPCQHVLVKDTFGLNFEVTVQRKDCNGGICTKSIDVTDTLLKQTYQIVKDVLVRTFLLRGNIY